MRHAASRLILAGLALALSATGSSGREGAVNALASDIARARNRAHSLLVQVERTTAPITPAGIGSEPLRLLGTGIALGGNRILTTAGVVGPADEVGILHQLRRYTARVVGVDRRTNVALLEVAGLILPEMPVAKDAMLFSGDLVIAVGLGPSSAPQASFGVVVVPEGEGPSLGYGAAEMVQTTAPAYRGLSGGVLLNPEGEMVGLISGTMEFDPNRVALPAGTAMVSGSLQDGRLVTTNAASATIALPVGEALDIAEELAKNGRVERGYIGLQVELVQVHERKSRPFPGVLVHRAVTKGPADKAGLIPGDVILEYASAKVESPDALSQLVAATLPGAVVPVLYLRRGSMSLANVHIEVAPEPAWDPQSDALISSASTGLVPATR